MVGRSQAERKFLNGVCDCRQQMWHGIWVRFYHYFKTESIILIRSKIRKRQWFGFYVSLCQDCLSSLGFFQKKCINSVVKDIERCHQRKKWGKKYLSLAPRNKSRKPSIEQKQNRYFFRHSQTTIKKKRMLLINWYQIF